MRQERVQRPVRAPDRRKAERRGHDAPQGREEVREDIRSIWFPEEQSG